MRNRIQIGALALVAIATVACNPFGKEPTTPTTVTTVVTVTQTQNPAPAPAPVAVPTPGGTQGQGPITDLKISFFTGSPGAGDKTLVVGEKGAITATPLNAQGVDPCKDVPTLDCSIYTQADIQWTPGIGIGGSCGGAAGPVAASTPWSDNTYNRNLEGCRPGDFEATATFRGSINGSLVGKVVASAQGSYVEGVGSWGGRFRRFVAALVP